MHILTGKWRGKSLVYPKKGLRPTQSRVREAVFDILQNDIENARFLDLCCGTGSMGLEALSRGAEHVTFVDQETKWVHKNVGFLPKTAYAIYTMECIRFLKKAALLPFSIIFFDPPWEKHSLYEDALKQILDFGILSPGGIFMCEHSKRVNLSSFGQTKTYRYGDAYITRLSASPVGYSVQIDT